MADAMKKIPKSIWALGFVSMFMDISSEMIHSLLPVFMVSVLGTSVTLVGIMEGGADALAQITKIFSGTLSDYLGKRKLLTLIGYGMAAAAKPLLPLAHSIPMALAGRFIDRIGKGVRDAPRDALIGDIVPPEIRGAAFGLRQSLDTIGAILGPIIALILMEFLLGNIRAVLWLAVIPALIAVVIMAVGVKEPEQKREGSARPPFHFRDIKLIGSSYWQLIAIAGMLSMARFSEAFLILKAQAIGLPVALAPMVLVIMNIVYALTAYPVGHISDRMDRKSMLLIGGAFLIAADIVLGFASEVWMLAAGVALWGLHLGFSQGLLAAMVADTAPAHMRGTAYGVYNFTCGMALLAASVIAGRLWDTVGPAAAFFTGAIFMLVAMAGLLFIRGKGEKRAG
jgi:MFS family permease